MPFQRGLGLFGMSADFVGRKKTCKRECCFHYSKQYIPSFTKKNIHTGQSTKKENDLKSQNTKINTSTPSKRKAKGKTVKGFKHWGILNRYDFPVLAMFSLKCHIIENLEIIMRKPWKDLRKRGYRCRLVNLRYI